MAQIKTVTTTSGENTITFDSFYPYVWIRNSGDNDITAANYSGASAGDENTVSIKAGEVAMIQAETESIYIIGATTCEIHAQGFAECPFKRGLGGGEQISVESLSVTTNGTYTAPTGTAYSPVTVDVQEQPWQPLQDGYSNFWFELTDDTLSPWLNFSAKNSDAVIDWGDGSGEQPLDTLTPTHTYAKAGRYVVKCKGVTGIAKQFDETQMPYAYVLIAAELNSNVNALEPYAFSQLMGLRYVDAKYAVNFGSSCFRLSGALRKITLSPTSWGSIGIGIFYMALSIESMQIPANITQIPSTTFYYLPMIKEITIPENVDSIGNSAFSYCISLNEIHIQATVPPTLGTNVFAGLPSNYIIYVPVGYGETYKAAAGWSAYADHILEEGQQVTRAMQRKFAKEAETIEEDTGDMR